MAQHANAYRHGAHFFCDPRSPWLSAARTRTPTACCASLPQRDTSIGTVLATSLLSRPNSTPTGRLSVGERHPKPSTNCYSHTSEDVLRRPLETGLRAAVAVMHVIDCRPGVEGLLERIEGEIAAANGHAPAHDPSRKDIDDEGHVDEAAPGGDVGEVGHPQLVGPCRHELAVDEVRWPRRRVIGGRGLDARPRTTPCSPIAALIAPPYSARRRCHRASALSPDLAGAVDAEVLVPHRGSAS